MADLGYLSNAIIMPQGWHTFLTIFYKQSAMGTNWRRLRESDLLIYLVLILSGIYLTFIALSIHEGIFYAGDQGIKSLVVKQIAQGYGFKSY